MALENFQGAFAASGSAISLISRVWNAMLESIKELHRFSNSFCGDLTLSPRPITSKNSDAHSLCGNSTPVPSCDIMYFLTSG